ncbi:hypothetical protein PFISCL1PPCAC_4310, partial [Pristionchus fissidentatus]
GHTVCSHCATRHTIRGTAVRCGSPNSIEGGVCAASHDHMMLHNQPIARHIPETLSEMLKPAFTCASCIVSSTTLNVVCVLCALRNRDGKGHARHYLVPASSLSATQPTVAAALQAATHAEGRNVQRLLHNVLGCTRCTTEYGTHCPNKHPVVSSCGCVCCNDCAAEMR